MFLSFLTDSFTEVTLPVNQSIAHRGNDGLQDDSNIQSACRQCIHLMSLITTDDGVPASGTETVWFIYSRQRCAPPHPHRVQLHCSSTNNDTTSYRRLGHNMILQFSSTLKSTVLYSLQLTCFSFICIGLYIQYMHIYFLTVVFTAVRL